MLTLQTSTELIECAVLRPIFVGGQAQAIGAIVRLTKSQYSELATAGKVGPVPEAPEQVQEAAPAKPRGRPPKHLENDK